MPLTIEGNASTNMFYLLKYLLLLDLVILKLKCNNFILNEILVLYASYVCLLHSCLIENLPIWILKDGPLISKVVLSQINYHPGKANIVADFTSMFSERLHESFKYCKIC
jgi:hypothetical protein